MCVGVWGNWWMCVGVSMGRSQANTGNCWGPFFSFQKHTQTRRVKYLNPLGREKAPCILTYSACSIIHTPPKYASNWIPKCYQTKYRQIFNCLVYEYIKKWHKSDSDEIKKMTSYLNKLLWDTPDTKIILRCWPAVFNNHTLMWWCDTSILLKKK